MATVFRKALTPTAPTALTEQSPSPPQEQIWTVSQLNQQVQRCLEQRFYQLAVSGELSNVRKDHGGHLWFYLKDDKGVLPAVLWRGKVAELNFVPKDGDQVIARGRITLYGPMGRYQLVAESMVAQGAGALQAAFEQLKMTLRSEGLFAQEKKRPLPLLPQRLAIITSPTGAVLRDILQVAIRRYPKLALLVIPTKVQGPASAGPIAQALAWLAEHHQSLGIDVAVIARGGGSLEDLWGFNAEEVVRAVANCPIPIVSAVGHETDVTLCDFAADVRAPTPSAAAELIFPEAAMLQRRIMELRMRLHRNADRQLQRCHVRLQRCRAALPDATGLMMRQQQRLAHLSDQVIWRVRHLLQRYRQGATRFQHRLQQLHPRQRLALLRPRLQRASERLRMAQQVQLQRQRQRLLAHQSQLVALSPTAILERGYSIVLNGQDRAIRSSAEVHAKESLTVQLHRGRLTVSVEQIVAGEVQGSSSL